MSERSLAATARHKQALELRLAGADYALIAEQLGYADPSGAYRAVKAALKASLREPSKRLRRIESERLDRLMLALWERAMGGDLPTVDRLLSIMARRARMLGLDQAPASEERANETVATLREFLAKDTTG